MFRGDTNPGGVTIHVRVHKSEFAMKTLFKIVFACCFGAWLCACKKDKQELPAITSKGANTFGCLVDGEPIVFTNPKLISGGLKTDSDSLGWLPYDSSDIWLVFENDYHNINILLNNPLSRTEWKFDKTTFIYPEVNHPKDYIMVDGFLSSEYTTGWFRAGDLSVTKPIFSGTFEFECINPRTCQTMKVTEGRLDVNLNQLQ